MAGHVCHSISERGEEERRRTQQKWSKSVSGRAGAPGTGQWPRQKEPGQTGEKNKNKKKNQAKGGKMGKKCPKIVPRDPAGVPRGLP